MQLVNLNIMNIDLFGKMEIYNNVNLVISFSSIRVKLISLIRMRKIEVVKISHFLMYLQGLTTDGKQ